MAMTITYDGDPDVPAPPGTLRKIIAAWTSDSCGDASGTTKKVRGVLIKGVTDPGAAAPTDNYDITVTDAEGVNVLGNCRDDLVDRDTTNTEEVYFLVSNLAATDPGGNVHPVVCDLLTITVANAGDTKDGELILYYMQG